MHSYGAWSATIRRAVACKFPTVVSSSATWAHRSGSCPRFRNSRRYFYPTYPGHGGISSSRRHYSASMENKEDTLLRAQATLAKLTSLTPRSSAHLGCLLSAAEQTESSPSSSSVQITVYGPDQALSAQKFVIAILDDPLSSEERLRFNLRERRSHSGLAHALHFHHDSHSHQSEASTPLPSPFLSRFSHPVSLQELSPHPSDSSHTLPAFLTSDIPILISSPFVAAPDFLSTLSPVLPANPHGIVLINSSIDTSSDPAKLIQSAQADLFHCDPSRVFFVDIDRALRGIEALRSNTHSPAAIKQYQDDFLGSNLPKVISILEETVKLGPAVLRSDSRVALTSRLITSSSSLLGSYHLELDDVQRLVSSLRSLTLEEKEKSLREVLGAASEETELGRLELGEEDGVIIKGIEKAAKDVKPALDSFTWWKLPLVVDDVSARIEQAAEGAYVKQFQNQLVYQTGRLSLLQTNLVTRAYDLLRSVPSTFNSSVLRNALSQVSSNPSFPLTATSLLSPLHSRLHQLTYATHALHVAAQRALLVTLSSSALSSTAAYALWIAGIVDGPTVLGAGLLAFAVGLRFAVGQWERAKKDWWDDWRRVGEGLERDVKKVAADVLDRQVCIVPLEACRGLETLVNKRRSEVAELENEIDKLREDEK